MKKKYGGIRVTPPFPCSGCHVWSPPKKKNPVHAYVTESNLYGLRQKPHNEIEIKNKSLFPFTLFMGLRLRSWAFPRWGALFPPPPLSGVAEKEGRRWRLQDFSDSTCCNKQFIIYLWMDLVPFPHLVLLEGLHHAEDALHHRGQVQEVQRLVCAQSKDGNWSMKVQNVQRRDRNMED